MYSLRKTEKRILHHHLMKLLDFYCRDLDNAYETRYRSSTATKKIAADCYRKRCAVQLILSDINYQPTIENDLKKQNLCHVKTDGRRRENKPCRPVKKLSHC